MNRRGRLFVITAPSGAGKTTLVHELISREPGLAFSISYTTRPQRKGEENGKDYFFVNQDEFTQMLGSNAFLEHAEVFDHHYGTSRDQVDELLSVGRNVILEIDWQGAAQVRANMPDCCSIFILPPSLEELERRLRGRATDSEEVIRRRFGDAVADMSHWSEFDYAVINDQLDTAADQLHAIIQGRAGDNRTDSSALRHRIKDILN